jgi:glycosyltransferase involved in cell wall biosynthesis
MPRFLLYLMGSRGHDHMLVETGPLAGVTAALLRGRFPASRYLGFVHDDPDDVVDHGRAVDVVKMASLVDRVLVTSASLREAVLCAGGDADRIDVLRPGVDTAVWQPAESPRGWLREHWGARPDDAVILFWGRLGDRVRVSVLCAVLRELERRALAHRVVLIAEGPAREEVERYLERHGLCERVLFHRPEEPATALKALAAADLFLLPLRGGTSVATVRALASGLPVLTAAVGGQAELVDATCGVLVEPGDERSEVLAYADAIEHLIGDPAGRRKLAAQARARALSQLGADRLIAAFTSALAAAAASSWRPGRLPDEDTAYERAVQRFRMVVRGEGMRVDRERLVALASEQARTLRDLQRWADELGEARRWLDDERRSWERVAGEHAEHAAVQKRTIERLDEARGWLEEQHQRWVQVAEERGGRVDDLEAARAWLDAERRRHESIAADSQERIEVLEELLARATGREPAQLMLDLEGRLRALQQERDQLAARLEALGAS